MLYGIIFCIYFRLEPKIDGKKKYIYIIIIIVLDDFVLK